MKTKHLIFLSVLVLLLSACTTSGLFTSAHLTNVELSEDNYKIVAKNVSGNAEAEYILGFSGAFRGEMQTLAFIRISGAGMLYQEALENLWKNFEAQTNQSVEGRKLALVNVRYDSDALNLFFLYSKPKISIRADVIEFEE